MSAAAATGKNRVDNTEQVYITSPNRAGTYSVTVSMDAALTTNAQPFALVITGAAASTTPTPTPSPSPSPSPTPTPTPTPVNPYPTVSLTSPTSGTSISLG
jgi:hypothetical protein